MSEGEPKPKMQLYVVSEVSGNPADWHAFPASRMFVLASSEQEACQIAESGLGAVAVYSDVPILLFEESVVPH